MMSIMLCTNKAAEFALAVLQETLERLDSCQDGDYSRILLRLEYLNRTLRARLYDLGYLRQPSPPFPPSYPGRANFSLLSLKNATNRLHENRELVSGGETTRVGELSRLGT